MRPTKIIAILFCFAITFFGCKKEVADVYPDLLGIWNSDSGSTTGDKMSIERDGKSSYTKGIYPNATTEQGKAKIKNDIMKIGDVELHITTYPTYDSDGNYYFIANDVKYYGVYGVSNPATTVSGQNVTFSWTTTVTPGGWSDSQRIEYKLASSSDWLSFGAGPSPSTYLLQGLASGTYEWRIKSVRQEVSTGVEHSSLYSPVQTFIIN
jgi:hypothetical protein